jgi:hypothetical protein
MIVDSCTAADYTPGRRPLPTTEMITLYPIITGTIVTKIRNQNIFLDPIAVPVHGQLLLLFDIYFHLFVFIIQYSKKIQTRETTCFQVQVVSYHDNEI